MTISTSRLKAADDVNCRARPASNTGLQRGDKSQQGNRVTAINPMQARLLRSRHTGRNKPRGCTELDSKENSRTIDVVRLHGGGSIALIRTAEEYRLSPPP
jgi:hypothetical protein